jgi:hypothetical protein
LNQTGRNIETRFLQRFNTSGNPNGVQNSEKWEMIDHVLRPSRFWPAQKSDRDHPDIPIRKYVNEKDTLANHIIIRIYLSGCNLSDIFQ